MTEYYDVNNYQIPIIITNDTQEQHSNKCFKTHNRIMICTNHNEQGSNSDRSLRVTKSPGCRHTHTIELGFLKLTVDLHAFTYLNRITGMGQAHQKDWAERCRRICFVILRAERCRRDRKSVV